MESSVKNQNPWPVQEATQALQIGPVRLPNGVCLAPLAGVSELPYRQICADLGAGLVVTELVSARGLRYAKSADKQQRYLAIDGLPYPTAIQLFGSEPEDFVFALEKIFNDEALAKVAIIDINMGCPVPKVVKSGSGAALMLDPARASAIVAAVKAICAPLGKACTVKTRSGFHAGQNIATEFCAQLATAGADAICLHARTRSQMYAGQADWSIFTEVRAALGDPLKGGVPLLANGDIVDGESALQVLQSSGAAGLMIGRAAMGNPWIFPEILHYLRSGTRLQRPSAAEIAELGLRHSRALVAQLGETVACRELRKTLGWYTKGQAHASELRRAAAQVVTLADIEDFWEGFATHKSTQESLH